MRNLCINCANFIVKGAINDPYLCRDCEKLFEGSELEESYSYVNH